MSIARELMPHQGPTLVLDRSARSGFELCAAEGPQCGAVFASRGERCAIGSHLSSDLVLGDPTVSRFHCEVVSTRGLSVGVAYVYWLASWHGMLGRQRGG